MQWQLWILHDTEVNTGNTMFMETFPIIAHYVEWETIGSIRWFYQLVAKAWFREPIRCTRVQVPMHLWEFGPNPSPLTSCP